MKARVKATGEILDVTRIMDKYILTNLPQTIMFEKDELDFSEDDSFDYWEKLKHQYAGMAMQGLLSNHLFFKDVDHVTNGKPEDMVTTIANSLATALFEKLKSGSNELE